MTQQQDIAVGKIIGVFGVKGWVKVFSDTQPRENILSYSPWLLTKGNDRKTVDIINGRLQGKAVVAQLAGVDDRDQAELLAGYRISISRQQLPEPEPDEYYWSDLVGLKVITETGQDLGEVDYLIETGANDVLVVKGDRERLIPFLPDQVIIDIDLDRSLLTVDWDPEF